MKTNTEKPKAEGDCSPAICSARKGFEEWFELNSLHEHSNWFRRDDDGDYSISFVDAQWECWKAANSWQNANDELATIANNLALRADYHRNNNNDPHGIGTASMSILSEVSDAITETLKGPCPDCEDTGWVGDQEAGGAYRNGRKTLNDEFQPCGCDRHELAKRRIARANVKDNLRDE